MGGGIPSYKIEAGIIKTNVESQTLVIPTNLKKIVGMLISADATLLSTINMLSFYKYKVSGYGPHTGFMFDSCGITLEPNRLLIHSCRNSYNDSIYRFGGALDYNYILIGE